MNDVASALVAFRSASRPEWHRALLFIAVGIACTIAGGLVSAVTSAAPFERGSWVAAYLVLVAGVSQVGLGYGQALLADHVPSWRVVAVEFAAWNVGNATIILGTLLTLPLLVDAGGILLMLTLVLLLVTTRRSVGSRWIRYSFRFLLLVLLLSIPVGSLLTRIG